LFFYLFRLILQFVFMFLKALYFFEIFIIFGNIFDFLENIKIRSNKIRSLEGLPLNLTSESIQEAKCHISQAFRHLMPPNATFLIPDESNECSIFPILIVLSKHFEKKDSQDIEAFFFSDKSVTSKNNPDSLFSYLVDSPTKLNTLPKAWITKNEIACIKPKKSIFDKISTLNFFNTSIEEFSEDDISENKEDTLKETEIFAKKKKTYRVILAIASVIVVIAIILIILGWKHYNKKFPISLLDASFVVVNIPSKV
jgi:energy-coupling factor transporter transmembrane protein EcfT